MLSIAMRVAILAGAVFLIPALLGALTARNGWPFKPVAWTSAGVTVGLVFYLLSYAKEKRRRLFLSREVTSIEEWYDKYYADSGLDRASVISVLESFAAEVGGSVHVSQLLPTDRLAREFALTCFGVPTEAYLEEVDLELAHRCGQCVPFNPDWRTIDDVIRDVAPILAEKARPEIES